MYKDKLDGLNPIFKAKLIKVLERMRARGLDAWVFEGVRTLERQKYLYSLGRRGRAGERPVTWTMHSNHIPDADGGRAADVISASQKWGAPPAFWEALHQEAEREGLVSGMSWHKKDPPHVEMPK